VPAAISSVLFLSGARDGLGEGQGPANCRAGVHVVGRCLPRCRVRSPSVAGGGARFSRKGVPSRLVFPVDVDEAMAAAWWWNNAPTCPRPVGALLRCRR
jgi:hypothetical protein